MKDTYESPLCSRYASPEMQRLFSPDMRFQTWRRLWVELARAEHALGLPVSAAQVAELEAHVADIDYETVAAREREVRHDVMAHVYAYGKCCPEAANRYTYSADELLCDGQCRLDPVSRRAAPHPRAGGGRAQDAGRV